MLLKDAIQLMYNHIVQEVGTKKIIDEALEDALKQFPSRHISIRLVKQVFDETSYLNQPGPNIELKQYLQDFSEEIIRAGKQKHQNCDCGVTESGHVLSMFGLFLLRYIELDSGQKISFQIKDIFPTRMTQVVNEFLKHAPSQN
ncbi:MAG: hypothetical protein Q8P20_10280 [bacterium]|nr:hypothetical protein [bacterium]